MTMSVITRNRLLAFHAEREQMRAKQASEPLTSQVANGEKVTPISTPVELVTDENQMATRAAVARFWQSRGYERVHPKTLLSGKDFDKLGDPEVAEEYKIAFGHLNAEHIHRDKFGRYWAIAPTGKNLHDGKGGAQATLTSRPRQATILKRGPVFTFRAVWGVAVFAADLIAEVFFHAGQALALIFTPPVWLVWNAVNAGLRGGAYIWRAIRPESEGATRLLHTARRVSMLETASELMLDLGMVALVPSWLLQPVGGNAGKLGHQLRKAQLFEYVVQLDDQRATGVAAGMSYAQTMDHIEALEAKIAAAEQAKKDKKSKAGSTWSQATDEVKAKSATKVKVRADRTNGWAKVVSQLEKESANYAKEKDPHKRSRKYGIYQACAAAADNPKVLSNLRIRNRVRTALHKEVQPRNSGFFTSDVLRGFDSAMRQLIKAAETEVTQVA